VAASPPAQAALRVAATVVIHASGLVELWRAGKHTNAELPELFSVARSTVYRAVQRAGERQA